MKKRILWYLLDTVFIIVFNAVFFILGGEARNMSVWLSYGFIHFAYLMLIVTPFLVRKSQSSAVFGFSLYSIGSSFFLIELITGMVFIILNLEAVKVPLITQLIITGLYAIMLLTNMIANENTADSLDRHYAELKYVKDCSSKIKPMIDTVSDKTTKKKVEAVYDLIHSSQVRSNNSVRKLEFDVMDQIELLEAAVNNNDKDEILTICGRITKLAKERNRKLKVSN